MKFFGKIDIKLSPDGASDIVGTMDRIEIKTEYHEIKKRGLVIQKRPKKLIIIAEKDYPL